MKCQKSGENLFLWAHLNENILVLHFLYIYRCTKYRVVVYGSLDILYPHRLWFIISSLSGSGDPVWWVRAHLSRPGLLSVCPGPGFLSVSPCLRSESPCCDKWSGPHSPALTLLSPLASPHSYSLPDHFLHIRWNQNRCTTTVFKNMIVVKVNLKTKQWQH